MFMLYAAIVEHREMQRPTGRALATLERDKNLPLPFGLTLVPFAIVPDPAKTISYLNIKQGWVDPNMAPLYVRVCLPGGFVL